MVLSFGLWELLSHIHRIFPQPSLMQHKDSALGRLEKMTRTKFEEMDTLMVDTFPKH